MPRSRAFLAILLAFTWCSAAWHVDLEAVGLILDHSHHGHSHGDHHHGPVDAPEEHEEFYARDVTHDHLRVLAEATLGMMFLALIPETGTAARMRAATQALTRQRSETGPPLARVWHFAQRCAPDSIAPPSQR